MRIFTYPLDAEDIEKIRSFVTLPVDSIKKSLTALNNSSVSTGTRAELSGTIDKIITKEAASELIAFVRGLRRNMEILNFSKEETIQAVEKGIADHGDQGILENWKAREDLISKFLDSPPIIISVKIGELLHQHNFHVHKFAVTTTVIPVFDDGRSRIAANIIKNVLFLTCSDANENEQILSYPVGEEDLRNLIRLAENALRKTDVIREEMTTVERPSIVYRAHP